MNILRTATLAAIFIKCITASSDVMSKFREAVDEGNLAKAVDLRWSIWGEHHFEMINYVVDKKDSDFILKFVKRTQTEKKDLLSALHRNTTPKEIIEKA